MASEAEIKLNTIVYFQADYEDDDGEEAKGRRHVVSEIRGDELFFLKITSRRKGLYARRAAGYADCLDKTSYVIFNRKIRFSFADLKVNNYQYFYICPLNHDGCLDKENFDSILQKTKEYWEDELIRDKDAIPVEANELKKPKNPP
ncbi:3489_t:CDS:1 [Entrophospora sp. SA101]|nr:6373_t:CDS:1 [Entrophospora sp. SA101]CAJ0635368.1 4694_t:CDS:1 [Entrophospora sp. SA101]CAJ0761419.1 3489_t:CDS:1 [Entrophospora sp. SA101]CAJ0834761.1 2273_t:CDS:1 [Entrophospora sp. SA101]CAJ0840893.1 995_t:CDS:1 [Entrophospora sp. SA101]